MKLNELKTPVETLSGVGPAQAKKFAHLNIFTVGDLLSTYPRSYEDRTKRRNLIDYTQGTVHTICQVRSHSWFGYGKMKTLKIEIWDGTVSAFLIAFNRAFLEKSFPPGSIVAVTGKFEIKYNNLQCSSFDAEKIADGGNIEDFAQAPVPGSGILTVYPLTEGLSQKIFRKAVLSALKLYGKSVEDEIPEDLIKSRSLLHKPECLEFIHNPSSFDQIALAKKTLVYEELYNFEYKMALRAIEHRGKLPTFEETSIFEAGNNDIISAKNSFVVPEETEESKNNFKNNFKDSLSPKQKALLENLPFELTWDQMKAIKEMNADIDQSQKDANALINGTKSFSNNPFSMQRLLQGDVGSGKTMVAFFVCLRVVDYGGQCVILAPTELLAKQHAENAAKLLEPIGVNVAFLTGNLKSKGREVLLNALKDGFVNIVVGTHALFSQNVTYKNLKLAIIDEQHRFGVAQRESIVQKGRISSEINGTSYTHTPDLLMMSATPIPQTLALTVFGDLDVTVIKSMPVGRKPVRTFLNVMGHENLVYDAVRNELKKGHQAYFVYPRIGQDEEFADEKSDNSLKNAEEMFNLLQTKVYPDFKCALVHGKIDEEEQNRILREFKENKIQVLVATTVVEVGVDVPNATCIVIEHADRFGLAELHQLRGRVGRSDLQSFCYLIYSKNLTEVGKMRLKAMHETTDGFKISEEDLNIRGPGEVSGTAQSGYLTLAVADLQRDKEILKIARYDAWTRLKNLMQQNP